MTRILVIGIITALGTAAPPAAMASAQSSAIPSAQAQPGGQATPDPREYLATAKRLLDAVPQTSFKKEEQREFARLREDVTHLVTIYETRNVVNWTNKFYDVERDFVAVLGGGASLSVSSTITAVEPASSTAQAAGPGSFATQSTGIAAPVTRVGRGSSPAQPEGTSGAAAAKITGVTPSIGPPSTTFGEVSVPEIGIQHLDSGLRTQLQLVRRNVELFYDATTRIASTRR